MPNPEMHPPQPVSDTLTMAASWTPERRSQYVPHEFINVLLLYMHDLLQGGLIALHHVDWVANFKRDENRHPDTNP